MDYLRAYSGFWVAPSIDREFDRLDDRTTEFTVETLPGFSDRFSMTFSAPHLEEGLHTTVSEHRNIGLYAGRALKLIAFYSVDLTHRVKRGIRFTRQHFKFWFSRT
jgi:hypothetical protein